jgi:CHAT domain-containing protein
MLVRPAGPFAKEARVHVVPDGVLHTLSFESLVVPGPRQHFWIEDVVLSNASSLQLLRRKAATASRARKMLIVGDAPTVEKYRRLDFAPDEIQRIRRRIADARVLSGTAATPSSYQRSNPGDYAFLHFVAHGESSRRWPLESAVILARDKNNEYKLLARDIIKQKLNADLVTISSCDGTGERTYTGEGVVGLAWAFLHAGADQVIAALWRVNDKTTPELMERMYAEILAGKDPAVALRNAKLEMVRSTSVRNRPRLWAPFVLYSGG